MTHPEQSRWFAEEVKPHEKSLRSYLRQSVRSINDVDDIVQECYMRMLRVQAAGDVVSSRALLFTVARNVVRDLMRRGAVAKLEPLGATTCLIEEGPGVVDFVSRKEELALLGEAILTLPERCREVFVLRRLKGVPQREIAIRLGISENTVETLVSRGIHACLQFMQEKGLAANRPRHGR